MCIYIYTYIHVCMATKFSTSDLQEICKHKLSVKILSVLNCKTKYRKKEEKNTCSARVALHRRCRPPPYRQHLLHPPPPDPRQSPPPPHRSLLPFPSPMQGYWARRGLCCRWFRPLEVLRHLIQSDFFISLDGCGVSSLCREMVLKVMAFNSMLE